MVETFKPACNFSTLVTVLALKSMSELKTTKPSCVPVLPAIEIARIHREDGRDVQAGLQLLDVGHSLGAQVDERAENHQAVLRPGAAGDRADAVEVALVEREDRAGRAG